MCGHVGVAGRIVQSDIKIFTQLLFADTFRGAHSTGLVSVQNKQPYYYKRALAAPDFLQLKPTNSMLVTSSSALIGHNRYATKGGVSDVTAHPFTHGSITLAHNGTLTNQYQLPDNSRFGVDSENICWAISKDGAAETLPKLGGSFALVWYDTQDGTLNFARNDEREFAMAISQGTLYWASEMKMLDWVLDRNNVYNYDLIELPVGQWWSCDPAKSINSFDDKNFKKVPFEVKKSYTHYGSGYYQGGGQAKKGKYIAAKKEMSLRDMGYSVNEEVIMIPTSFQLYQNNKKIGNLMGYDEDNPDQQVVVFGANKSDIVFNTTGSVSTAVSYLGKVQGRANMSDDGPYVSLSAQTIVALPASGDDEEEQEEKKHCASSTDYQDCTVDGVKVKGHEFEFLLNRGCAWCGNPFSVDGLRSAKVTDYGDFVHRHVCWDEAKSHGLIEEVI